MKKRAALGLSINLLVTVIISLVILIGGIAFLYQLIGGAEEIKTELDVRTQAELERLLIDQGKKVALPYHAATIPRGETHVFGLGILNIDESKFGDEFRLEISLSKALDETKKEYPSPPSTDSWLFYNPGPFTIKENQHRSEPLLVKVPKDAPQGTYIFNVQVICQGEKDLCQPYDSIKKFTVIIK